MTDQALDALARAAGIAVRWQGAFGDAQTVSVETLRALEAEKSEKVSLQTILNNTRTAYGKLRNEVADLVLPSQRRPEGMRPRPARDLVHVVAAELVHGRGIS